MPTSDICIRFFEFLSVASTSNRTTTVKDYIATTQVGSAQNTVAVTTTLPVSLVSFNANWKNETVKLDWSTATESNSNSFEIERSNDNSSFIKIGSVAAAGNSTIKTNYSFTDNYAGYDINYYRLKMLDIDQHYKYSAVIVVRKNTNNFQVKSVFPNPFISEIQVGITLNKNQNIRLNLLNNEGKLLLSKDTKGKTGINTILLNNLGSLSKGIYLLQLVTENGNINEKLLKIN